MYTKVDDDKEKTNDIRCWCLPIISSRCLDLPRLLSLLPLVVIRRVTVRTWTCEEGEELRCIICQITRRGEVDHHFFFERQRNDIVELRYFSSSFFLPIRVYFRNSSSVAFLLPSSFLCRAVCYVIFPNQSFSARRYVQHLRRCLRILMKGERGREEEEIIRSRMHRHPTRASFCLICLFSLLFRSLVIPTIPA